LHFFFGHIIYSQDVAHQFLDESLAFVYIDGNHYFEGVSQDIQLYWPKVMPGGIIAGHDFTDSYEGKFHNPQEPSV
jgi:hypothetical protein